MRYVFKREKKYILDAMSRRDSPFITDDDGSANVPWI